MQILNQSQNTVIAKQAEVADTVVSRLVGLLGRDTLPEEHALIITQCRSIHMLFMRFPIDAIFVDKNNRAIGLVENLRPFFFSPYYFRASYVIELPAGTIKATKTVMKDEIRLEK